MAFQLILGLWLMIAVALLGIQISILLVFFEGKTGEISLQNLVDQLLSNWPQWGAGIAMLFIAEAILRREARMPIQEQRKYYALTGQGWLDDARRYVLHLDAVRCYNNGLWSETLAPQPMWEHLQTSIKFKHLKPGHAETYRKRLEMQWEVFDNESYFTCIKQCLHGRFSEHFLYALNTDSDRSIHKNLAQLMQIRSGYLRQCLQPGPDKRPAKLVWGFDLYLIIQISRESYAAGYIDEQTAWSNILHVSN